MFEQFEQDANSQSSERDWTADACGETPIATPGRFALFTAAFLTMLPGSVILFIWLGDTRYGVQFASMVGYTAAAILYTFSANRGMQRYLFDCPYVRSQFGRLAVRHAGFLAAQFFIQTAALSFRPKLPPWWLTEGPGAKDMPPFVVVMFGLSGTLLLAEVLTNRSILERAHNTEDAPNSGLD